MSKKARFKTARCFCLSPCRQSTTEILRLGNIAALLFRWEKTATKVRGTIYQLVNIPDLGKEVCGRWQISQTWWRGYHCLIKNGKRAWGKKRTDFKPKSGFTKLLPLTSDCFLGECPPDWLGRSWIQRSGHWGWAKNNRRRCSGRGWSHRPGN